MSADRVEDPEAYIRAAEARAARERRHAVRIECAMADSGLIDAAERAGYFPTATDRHRVRLDKDLGAAAELAAAVPAWRAELTGTLTFVMDGGRVLLIRKKTGHGAGKINAPGGKLEAGETPLACAVRETREETGVSVLEPRLMAELKFIDSAGPQWYGYVYLAQRYRGRPQETAEAAPAWYALDELPFHEMWQDDRIWLPRVLAEQRLSGEFLFRAGRLRAHRVHPRPAP